MSLMYGLNIKGEEDRSRSTTTINYLANTLYQRCTEIIETYIYADDTAKTDQTTKYLDQEIERRQIVIGYKLMEETNTRSSEQDQSKNQNEQTALDDEEDQ